MRSLASTPERLAVVTRWACAFELPASLENSANAARRNGTTRLRFPNTPIGCFFYHLLDQTPDLSSSIHDDEPLPAVLPLLRNTPAVLGRDSGSVFILENLDMVRLAFRVEPDICLADVDSSMIGGVRIGPLSPSWARCATTLLTAAAFGELYDLYRPHVD